MDMSTGLLIAAAFSQSAVLLMLQRKYRRALEMAGHYEAALSIADAGTAHAEGLHEDLESDVRDAVAALEAGWDQTAYAILTGNAREVRDQRDAPVVREAYHAGYLQGYHDCKMDADAGEMRSVVKPGDSFMVWRYAD